MSLNQATPQQTIVQQADPKSLRPITSPCCNICALNDEGFCVGCYRDGNEIRLWNTYSDTQKQQVLNSCQRRAELDNAFI